jgi:hypothetical protein
MRQSCEKPSWIGKWKTENGNWGGVAPTVFVRV